MMGIVSAALMGCGSSKQNILTGSGVIAGEATVAGKPVIVMRLTGNAQVRFVSHKQTGFAGAPSVDDSTILLNVAAAFTLDTETMDVCGDQVVAGEYIKGYGDVTATGHMLIVGNSVSIKGNNSLDESIKAAQEGKGYLFQQCYIVENGRGVVERIPQAIRDRQAHIIFRAACIMSDGSLAIVQGAEKMYCGEFIDALVALGAQQALYLDMGTWAWGWVRENGKTTELAERFSNTRYQSNWLQVIKQN